MLSELRGSESDEHWDAMRGTDGGKIEYSAPDTEPGKQWFYPGYETTRERILKRTMQFVQFPETQNAG